MGSGWSSFPSWGLTEGGPARNFLSGVDAAQGLRIAASKIFTSG